MAATKKTDVTNMEPNAFIKQTKMRIRFTFVEPVLGSAPADPKIYEKYIASKAPEGTDISEEIEALGVDEVMENQITVFPRKKVRENGKVVDEIPAIWHYHIKGYFKDTCKALKKTSGTISSNMTQYKQIIDKMIFPFPRLIAFENYDISDMTINQRPLRASGPMGERVALAASEQIPAGAQIEFELTINDTTYVNAVREWFNFGIYAGFGQWRNSGKGRFFWEELSKDGQVIGGNMPEDFEDYDIEEW